MKKREGGFSLIELVIAVAIVLVVLASAMSFFIISMKQFKTQTKITASGMEGIMGLELLRRDIEDMGFGLPWNNLPAYTEANGNAAVLNDGPNIAPRAIVGMDNPGFTLNNSDYLAIKSAKVGVVAVTGVGRTSPAGKWTHLGYTGNKRVWAPASENMVDSDHVIVLAVGSTDANRRWLVNPAGASYTTYNNTAAYVPDEMRSTNIIYGIADSSTPMLVRPFNRADYYVSSTVGLVPKHCAPGTGVLVKGLLSHDAAGTISELPLLDCVADMQVAYGLFDPVARQVIWSSELVSSTGVELTAAEIRDQLVEVRVSILAQEGQMDESFRYPNDIIFVGSMGVGRNFDINTLPEQIHIMGSAHLQCSVCGGNHKARHYRWKVHNLAVRPLSLAQ